MLRNLIVALAATAAVAVAGNAGAAPIVAPGTTRAAADGLNIVESVQFIWLGHDYCWYDDGWNGPGWYWCGYAFNRGYGYGGGYGWHHWRGGHPRSYYQGRRGGHDGGKAVTRSKSGGGKAVTRSKSGGGKAVTHSKGGGGKAVTRSSGGGGKGGGGGKSGGGGKGGGGK
jgi:hypothetical protein